MAKDKMKSEDAVPQADTQAHTEMAEREGQQAGRAGPTDQQGTRRKRSPKNWRVAFSCAISRRCA
jgi:hypothetical protein